jgi:putative transposase
VQDLIQEVLQESHLNKQKLKISAIRRLIEARCRQVGLAVPAYNTVLTRVLQLSSCDRIKARIGAKEAREAATIHRGPFEEAEYPLAIVQIDHTPLDIILVDEAARLPIGRPWLTLAIDVYSRMVVGYCLTFDPTGAISVGLCLVHAILPKDAWLAKFGLKAEWPCWGVPTTIHADNGKDFRCESLQRACLEHRINIEWRPLRRANFGGHIERLLGTFLQEMHQLAGTTFSNVAERGNYDAVKTAAFTLREFECWLANLITGNYHQRPHGGLEGQCPLRRYEEGRNASPPRPSGNSAGCPPTRGNTRRRDWARKFGRHFARF